MEESITMRRRQTITFKVRNLRFSKVSYSVVIFPALNCAQEYTITCPVLEVLAGREA